MRPLVPGSTEENFYLKTILEHAFLFFLIFKEDFYEISLGWVTYISKQVGGNEQ